MAAEKDWLKEYLEQRVVVDLDSRHVVVGDLLDFSSDHLELGNVDLHDCERANSTKEVYLGEAAQYGVNVNRKKIAVPRRRILAISRLEDADLA